MFFTNERVVIPKEIIIKNKVKFTIRKFTQYIK